MDKKIEEYLKKYMEKLEKVESRREGLRHQNDLTDTDDYYLDQEKVLLSEIRRDLKSIQGLLEQ